MNYTHKIPAGYLVTDTEAGLEDEPMTRAETAGYIQKRIAEMGWRLERVLGSLDEGRSMIAFFPELFDRGDFDTELIIAVAYYAA